METTLLPIALSALGTLIVICLGVVISLLRGLVATSGRHEKTFSRFETILTGPTGDNGVCGDVKAVRAVVHDLGDDMQFVFLKLGVERRVRDRRSA
jgi:hypothetical protein